MLRHKPLVASLILAGVLAATDASALGLGRLSVTTALGQPLVAEVDLATSPGDDADSIRANVASPAVYRAANVEYQSVLQNVRAQVLKRPNGQPYVRLTSSQAVNDPYLDILLEVNSSTGRLVREYVFLLDPPGAAAPQAIEPSQPARPPIPAQSAPATTAKAPAAPRVAAASPVESPAASVASDGSAYAVKRGDTLSGIAGRNVQAGVSIEQMMIAIQRANPNAFIGNNINRLRSGVTLNMPASADAQGIAQNTAVSEVRAQASSWRGYVARVSDSVPTVNADQATARASGRVSGAVADTGTSPSSSDKLKLSQGERTKQANTESKVAATKALKEEQSRIAALEKIKQDAAVALQNQKLAEAQAKAREAAKPAPAPVPAPVAAAPVAPPPPPAPAPAPAPIAKVDPPKAEAPKAEPPKAEPPKAAEAPKPEQPVPTPVAAAPAPAPAAAPAPAPAAAAAPPVTPAPKPAPAVAAPSAPVEAEAGMFDGLLDNPLVPAGAGLAALLGGVFLWSRRRKTPTDPITSSKMMDPVVNTMNPDTVFGTSGLGVVKTNDVPVQSQFSRSGMGTIDSSEVDPVAEAEVYIAYGREAQAEEILREALIRDPQRPDVATKLAEISAVQGKREEFDRISADVLAMDRNGEYKQKLADIALAHFPGHATAGGVAVSTASKGAAADSSVIAPAIGAVAATAATAAAAAVAAKSMFSDNTPVAEHITTVPPTSASNGALDFVLDGMTIAKPTPAPEPAVMPEPVAAPAPAPLAPRASAIPAFSSAPSSASKKSLEQDLAELEESLKKATASGKLPESNMDFTDFSTATPTNLGTVGPSMRPEMLDLSFDAGRQGFVDPTPSILDGQWHDASTKLDLARAYEEMGDREGAREILREVIHDGDEAQQSEAKAMLAKLGG